MASIDGAKKVETIVKGITGTLVILMPLVCIVWIWVDGWLGAKIVGSYCLVVLCAGIITWCTEERRKDVEAGKE